MADLEFEEFCQFDDDFSDSNHIKTSSGTYTLVHDVALNEEKITENELLTATSNSQHTQIKTDTCQTNGVFEANNRAYILNKELLANNTNDNNWFPLKSPVHDFQMKSPNSEWKQEERSNLSSRKKRNNGSLMSLAEEFEHVFTSIQPYLNLTTNSISSFHSATENPYLSDSELCDSGNSTAHSPDYCASRCSSNSFTHIELLEATHRALYKFIGRHSDEMELDIGDPIYVQKEAEDMWYEGINLRTGNRGIFPSAYAVDVEYNDFDPNVPQIKRERFLLQYLGSVETLYHKGNPVLCQAIQKIIMRKYKCYSCILEVSDQGLKMYDGMKPDRRTEQILDYFYSLKNVSFCGFHPQDSRMMGFITKHPQCDKFACHVFRSDGTTRPIIESIGRAFQRFYKKYIETAYPVEDIYIE